MRPTRRDRPGTARLFAALRRLATPLPAPAPGAAAPETAWEHETDARLTAVEQALNNQNRLLLIAIITTALDLVVGLTK